MIIRLMGEIDIHSFRTDKLLSEQPAMINLKLPDGASHTYHLLSCPVQQSVDFDDDEAMSSAETQSLHAMVPIMKRTRKQFANSSGLRQFLKNLS